MKRFLFLAVLVAVAFWVLARHRMTCVRPAMTHDRHATHGEAFGAQRSVEARAVRDAARRAKDEARRKAREALAEARRGLQEARREIGEAFEEAREEVRQAFDEAHESVAFAEEETSPDKGGAASRAPVREVADGLPVPIVPGSRVTEAKLQPPAPPAPPAEGCPATGVCEEEKGTSGPVPPAAVGSPSKRTHTVTGLLSATQERAVAAARRELQRTVAEWLGPEVPKSWEAPAELVNALVLETRTSPVHRDYGEHGTVYETKLEIDVSPQQRAALVNAYNHELVAHRLVNLGGALAFVLVCLGALCSYIRADEVTKGYYTNRLRMLAAAGVGAAAVVIYRLIA
jgi:hypothetical protein